MGFVLFVRVLGAHLKAWHRVGSCDTKEVAQGVICGALGRDSSHPPCPPAPQEPQFWHSTGRGTFLDGLFLEINQSMSVFSWARRPEERGLPARSPPLEEEG